MARIPCLHLSLTIYQYELMRVHMHVCILMCIQKHVCVYINRDQNLLLNKVTFGGYVCYKRIVLYVTTMTLILLPKVNYEPLILGNTILTI